MLRDFFFSDFVSDNKIMLLMMYWKIDYKMVNFFCNCFIGFFMLFKKFLCMYCWIWKLIFSFYFFIVCKVNILSVFLEVICVVWNVIFEKIKSDNVFFFVIVLSCFKILFMYLYKLKFLYLIFEFILKFLLDYIW